MDYPLCRNATLPWAARLAHAVTAYDRRQSTRRDYNANALGIYLGRADDVAARIDAGDAPRDAICDGFCGPLQAFILKVTATA
jgi:hypothetical protein